MLLLDLGKIASRLDEESRSFPMSIPGLRLVQNTSLTREAVAVWEGKHDLSLPQSIVEVALRYDFGCLSLGSIHFGLSGDFLEELEIRNSSEDYPWWGSGARPESLLMIANSDSFAILANMNNSEIMAMRHGDLPSEAMRVASTFLLFLRGVGTIVVRRFDGEALSLEEIAREVGSSDEGMVFWRGQ